MVSAKIFTNTTCEKTINRVAGVLLAALISASVSGCGISNTETRMRSWQELRKAATVKYGQAQDRGALALYIKALQEANSMGPNSVARSISLNELSQIILVTGDKMPVQDYIDAALQQVDFWLKTDSANPERVVSMTELSESLYNFAGILRQADDAVQAQKLDERAMQICQAEAATASTSTPDILLGYRWGRIVCALGEDYLAQSKKEEGRKALKAAMETKLTACIPQTVGERIVTVYGKLGTGKGSLSKTQLAEELGLSGTGEENAPISQWSKYLRAGKGFLLGRHDAASAVPMLVKAVEQAKKTSDPDIPAAQSLYFLGIAYEESKQPAKAEAALLESATLLENNASAADDLQNTLGRLVSHYRKQKNFDQAEKYASERVTVIKSFFGAESTETGLALMQLAEILKAKNQFAGAESTGQEALTIVSKNLDHDDARLALTKTLMASIYIAEKKYSLARPILADAMKIWSTRRSENVAAALYADNLYAALRKGEDAAHAGGT